jgi:competence protein ComEA
VTIGDRIAVAALVTALAAIGLGAWVVLSVGMGSDPTPDALLDPFASASSSLDLAAPNVLVVDVEGAVRHPGIIELPVGARVGDAIAAAGGYGSNADIGAAAAQVNLAAVVHDGQQIVVPLVGATQGGDGGGGGATSDGLVNLNSASGEALDALPGIGPVTVQKILSARAEQPFGSLEQLVSRKVLTTSQLDKIRDLITLG